MAIGWWVVEGPESTHEVTGYVNSRLGDMTGLARGLGSQLPSSTHEDVLRVKGDPIRIGGIRMCLGLMASQSFEKCASEGDSKSGLH
ncbi:hypothetical protein LWI28_006073 [Acer negundo]|uniref:Uncharacterized protein n=1 Tax=Acer negundo TaxID=4023 RepID=A0AAD5J383_ACENE|nr:hypothetical protein LWI28_006073 [Acer negundo]